MFKRLKTAHEYHDSLITDVRWCGPCDLELDIRFDTNWNNKGTSTALLRFVNVKNRAEVQTTSKQLRRTELMTNG
jgi:hypothetical protein